MTQASKLVTIPFVQLIHNAHFTKCFQLCKMVNGKANEQRRQGSQIPQVITRLGTASAQLPLVEQQRMQRTLLVWISPAGSHDDPWQGPLQAGKIPPAQMGVLHCMHHLLAM